MSYGLVMGWVKILGECVSNYKYYFLMKNKESRRSSPLVFINNGPNGFNLSNILHVFVVHLDQLIMNLWIFFSNYL